MAPCLTDHANVTIPPRCTLDAYTLKRVSPQINLVVIIDEQLKPSLHCSRAANRAFGAMRATRNSFLRIDEKLFGCIYYTHVRTYLEFAAPVRRPWLQKDIDVLERTGDQLNWSKACVTSTTAIW